MIPSLKNEKKGKKSLKQKVEEAASITPVVIGIDQNYGVLAMCMKNICVLDIFLILLFLFVNLILTVAYFWFIT